MKKLFVVLVLMFCVSNVMQAGYKDDVDMDIVNQVVNNRFTESSKVAAEKTNGMSEEEEQYRLRYLLEELNKYSEEGKYPMDSMLREINEHHKRITRLEMDINALLDLMAELEKKHKEDVDTLMEFITELEGKISIINGEKNLEDMERIKKIAEDL